MEQFLTVLLFIVGLGLIIKGGDWFVDAASAFAEATGIPKFVVGATVVSFATTLPELIVSVLAVIEGSNGIAIGNAVGSVTANVGLIMGVSVLCLPAVVKIKDFAVKSLIMIGATAALMLCCLGGEMRLWGAFIVLAFLVLFFATTLVSLKKDRAETEDAARLKPTRKEWVMTVLKFIFGAAGIVGGAQLLVTYGTKLAEMLGVPDSVIGLTMVAVGTSLPELVTAIVAIAKKETSMSVGNILGANIIDMTLILPVCTFISSGGVLTVDSLTVYRDVPFTIAIMLVAVVPTLFMKKLKRWQGAVMLAIYAAFVVLTVVMK